MSKGYSRVEGKRPRKLIFHLKVEPGRHIKIFPTALLLSVGPHTPHTNGGVCGSTPLCPLRGALPRYLTQRGRPTPSVIANSYILREIDTTDPEHFMWSSTLFTSTVEHGLWDGQGVFSWAAVLGEFGDRPWYASVRLYSVYNRVAPGLGVQARASPPPLRLSGYCNRGSVPIASPLGHLGITTAGEFRSNAKPIYPLANRDGHDPYTPKKAWLGGNFPVSVWHSVTTYMRVVRG